LVDLDADSFASGGEFVVMRSQRRRPKPVFLLCLEVLEGRELLSGSAVAQWHTIATSAPFVGPVQVSQTTTAKSAASNSNSSSYSDSSSSSDDYYYPSYTSSQKSYDYYATPQSSSASMQVIVPPKPPAPVEIIRPVTAVEAPPPPTFFPAREPARIAADPQTKNVTNATVAGASGEAVLANSEAVASVALAAPAVAERTESESFAVIGPAAPSAELVLAPQLGNLLAGSLYVNLAQIKGSVDQFFARLETLTDVLMPGQSTSLWQWVLMSTSVAAAFEFLRRRAAPTADRAEDASGQPVWAPYPLLTVLPPEDLP
jgi:hypothetical protein